MENTISALKEILKDFPSFWDGKEAILEMKNAGDRWRDNQWVGWYFEYLCRKELPRAGMSVPGTRYDNTTFDGNEIIDWDFKSHSTYDKDGREQFDLPVNDLKAITSSIKENEKIGLIVAIGEPEFEDPITTPFHKWHTSIKGRSKYSQERERRGAKPKLYKTSFKLKSINFYLLTEQDVEKQGRFQEGWRNSNGSLRPVKLKINLRTIEPVDKIQF